MIWSRIHGWPISIDLKLYRYFRCLAKDFLDSALSQWTHDVVSTSIRRLYDVVTSYRRLIDVETMWCVYWEEIENMIPILKFIKSSTVTLRKQRFSQ